MPNKQTNKAPLREAGRQHRTATAAAENQEAVSFEIGVLELGVREASGWASDTVREGVTGEPRAIMARSDASEAKQRKKAIFFLQSWKECHRLRVQLDKQRGSKLQAI